ncbi:MAG: ABC transporter ATP-binding protein [Oscillospiraceae bacterium]|nr:ABC transporter ATP-binding protein [Oscillospiraceae bacterium]
MSLLEVRDLTVRLGEKTIVNNVSFTLEEGRWLMLIGPNGAGKSTIVNAVTQSVPYTGEILFNGENVRRYRPTELAKNIGILAQSHSVGYSFTVEEVVRLGRYSYAPGIFSRHSDADEESVERALDLTGLRPLMEQSVLTLSGGELQRTFLAQLLAQNPRVLILDEPTNHLDLVYQKQIFALISDWLSETGRAVISVVHDLSLARAYGTDALLLSGGRMVYGGTIDGAFEPDRLNEVYSMDVGGWMRSMLGQWQ